MSDHEHLPRPPIHIHTTNDPGLGPTSPFPEPSLAPPPIDRGSVLIGRLLGLLGVLAAGGAAAAFLS